MEKEKAIEILNEVKVLDDSIYQYSSAYMEALDMAIEALENRIEEKEADLISDVFQDLCCAGIETIANGDETARSIFEKIGLIEREKTLCEK